MKIKFRTDGAAFKADSDNELLDNVTMICESKRILEKIVQELMTDKTSGTILDINDNKIGEWSL